jgi:hypothetical protein
MDVGLIPFFILTTMVGSAQYNMAADTKDRWTSFLDSVYATNQMIQTVWMTSAVMSAMHGFSSCIDLFLIIIFRKISALPPDMNPLEEDKLTRRKTKHKYKNSEVTLVDEKHMSDFMGTTAASSPNRMSRASESAHSDRTSRGISFTQSRSGEKSIYSPHNPKTAHISRASLADGMYQQNGAATSKVNLHRPISSEDVAFSHRTSPMPSHPSMPKRASVVSSTNSSNDRLNRDSREDLDKDNWFAIGDGTEDDQDEPSRHNPYVYTAPQQRSPQRSPQRTAPQQLFAHPMGPDHRNYREPVREDNHSHLPAGHPLHMNPPTPRNLEQAPPSPPPQPIALRNASKPLATTKIGFSHHIATRSRADDELLAHAERSKTMTSEVSALSGSSKYSDQETTISDLSNGQTGFSSRAAPSRQLYGDLAAAMRGVRHQPVISPRPKSMVGSLHWASSDVSYSDAASNAASSRGGRSHVGTVVRKDRSPVSDIDEDEDQPLGNKWSGYGRVVSRTGVDMDPRGDIGTAARRREVSGKVAEEGRAGANSGWFSGGMFRRTSGFQS